jgi:hypothetical protein
VLVALAQAAGQGGAGGERKPNKQRGRLHRGEMCTSVEGRWGRGKAGLWAWVRLSPAGDGAEDAGETCEEQKRSTWWMVGLVGGSGQGLFTWETKSSRSVSCSSRQGRRAGRSESRDPVVRCAALCNALHGDCTENWETRPHDSSGRLQLSRGRCRQAGHGPQRAGRCLLRQSRRGTRDVRAAACSVHGLANAHDVRPFKAPLLPTRKRAIGLV